jgi:hypothetical protein
VVAVSLAASLAVPAGVAQVARAIDPERRATHTVGEEIQSRTPFASRSLNPQRDVWGQPITTDRLGPDILSPITQTDRKNDPVNAEMIRLHAPATQFPKSHTVNGQRIDYTPQEQDRLAAMAGKSAHDAISGMVKADGWKGLTDDAQRKAIKQAIAGERSDARASLPAPATPPPPAGFSANGNVPPPPPGFAVEGAAGGRNVYADLLRVIPGLTEGNLTSGFRTPAYQADMKRRGYHPADNSGHLDGSSFDIVPPRGRSIGWVAQQVKAYDPTARLLPEGDHLHVTFPGYYGAPAIGGARKAGLRNPLQGMPPPPAGFRIDGQ